MKHILFIHHTLGGGGAERALISFLNRFDRSRWRITLLLLGGGPLLKEVPEDVEVILLPPVRGERHFPAFAAWRRGKSAIQRLSGRSFDLTVSFMEGHASMLHSRLLHLAPLSAAWVHCDLQEHRWYNWQSEEEKKYYASLDGRAAVSVAAAGALKRLYQVDSQIVANPIDTISVADTVQAVGEGFRVAFVGRLVEVKRPDRFLEALALLRESGIDARGVIMGIGGMEPALKLQASRLGLDHSVEWCGFTPERLSIMASCQALCISSRSEGRPVVAEEAAALGLPVVATPVGGVAERLGDWCIPVGFSADSIAFGLEKVARGEWVKPEQSFQAPGIGQMEAFLTEVLKKRSVTG